MLPLTKISYSLVWKCVLFLTVSFSSLRGIQCKAPFDWFISKAHGNDIASCGSNQSPCKSLTVVLPRVAWGARIFLDGTNTHTNPYTCDATIVVNQSLALIGWKSPPEWKCWNGLMFNGSGGSQSGDLAVLLSDLHFIDTPLVFDNCSVRIEKLHYTNSTRPNGGIRITSALDVMIVNSVFTSSAGITMSQSPSITVDDVTFQDMTRGALNIDLGGAKASVNLTDLVFARNERGLRILGPHQSYINLQNSVFTGHTDSYSLEIRVDSYSRVVIDNITVENSEIKSGFTNIQGAAVYIAGGYSGVNTFEIKDSRFESNVNTASGSGAVLLDNSPDILQTSGCATDDIFKKKYPTFQYVNFVVFKDTVFVFNAGVQSGAIYHSNGKATYINCSFVDNFSVKRNLGQILVAGGSGSFNMMNSSFLRTSKTYRASRPFSVSGSGSFSTSGSGSFSGSRFLVADSTARLTLSNTVFESSPITDLNLVSFLDNGYLNVDNSTIFVCPLGSEISVTDYSHFFTRRLNNNSTSLQCRSYNHQYEITCIPCGMGMYTLHRAYVRGLVINSETMESRCRACPFGGNCTQNLIALPHFWGSPSKNYPDSIEFYFCPLRYCKPPIDLPPDVINGCQGNREGITCGSCAVGYSESLFDTDCSCREEDVNPWFWPVMVLLAGLFAGYLICKPPVATFVVAHILWFRRDKESTSGLSTSQLTNESIVKDSASNPGYLKIIFYFYQVVPLVLISASTGELLYKNIILPIVGSFSFKVTTSHTDLGCPFTGLTAVTKEIFLTMGVFVIALLLVLGYVIHRLVTRIRRRQAPSFAPYLAAMTEISLLSYSTLTTAALKLMVCPTVDGTSRMFYDGDVICYQWWHYVLVVICIIYVIPYVIVLYWGSVLLTRRQLSAREFVFASTSPLVFLVRWAIRSKQELETKLELELERQAVMNVLQAPFRSSKKGGKGALYWESILIARRFLLIVSNSFITQSSLRLFCISVLCVGFAVHHLIKKPYKNTTANRLETVSLTTLTIISISSTVQATFISANQNPTGPNLTYVHALLVCETVVLAAIPCLAVLSLVFVVFSQLVRCLFIVVYVCQVFPPRSRPPSSPGRKLQMDSQFNDKLPGTVDVNVTDADVMSGEAKDNELANASSGYDNLSYDNMN